MTCVKQQHFQRLPGAYDAITRLDDPWLQPYVCREHRAIHIGHPPFKSRIYSSWEIALEATEKILRNRGDKARMRVWKSEDGWTIAPARSRNQLPMNASLRVKTPQVPLTEKLGRQIPPGVLDGVPFRIVGLIE